jgi:beta-mannosidase
MPGGLATRVHHPAWKQRSPRDLGAGWDFDDVRDHYVQLLFGVEPQKLRWSDHERYLALGRVATGEVMAASFAEWRRPASGCGGALVLMLRDLWAGAGWGLVDEAGAPKACWHYLKRILQPVTLFLTDEGVNGLFLQLVNETSHPRSVEVELAAWRSGEVKVAAGSARLTLPARGAQSLACVSLLDHFMDLAYAYRFGPLPCDAVVATLRDEGGRQLAQAFHFPGGIPAAPQPNVGLEARAREIGDGCVQLTVRAARLALGIHFEIPGFIADDEYFHLAPHGEAQVTLRGAGRLPAGACVSAINMTTPVRIETGPALETTT